MPENDDQWLWFDDEESEQSPLKVDSGSAEGKTAADSPEVVKAIHLHLSGRAKKL